MPIKKVGYKKRAYRKRRTVRKKKLTVSKMIKNRGYLKCNRGMLECYIGASNTATEYTLVNPLSGNPFVNGGTPITDALITNMFSIPLIFSVNLAQVINYLEFAQLFDQYRILGVQMILKLTQTEAGPSDSLPYIEYYYDQDDTLLPTNSSIRERSDVKYKSFGSNGMLKLNWYPYPQNIVSNTGSSVVATNPMTNKTWIDTTNAVLPYKSLKMILRNCRLNGTNNRWRIDFIPRVLFDFKNVQ